MADAQTIETYLARMTVPYRAEAKGLWIVDDGGDEIPPIVVHCDGPLVLFECKVMAVPEGAGAAFFRRLLELNAVGMTAGAYGVDGAWVVVTDALQSENLDFNEFQGAIDGIVLALSEHFPLLRELAAN